MKLYRVTFASTHRGIVHVAWATSKREAAKQHSFARRTVHDDQWGTVKTEILDAPLSRTKLVEFLNTYACLASTEK